jgi:hypothetical protein
LAEELDDDEIRTGVRRDLARIWAAAQKSA